MWWMSKEQYLETMDEMTDITSESEHESLVDIWRYAKELENKRLLSKHMFNRRLIEAVYRNDKNSVHHVLLFGNEKNIYVVIVIDVKKAIILGHYLLDLNDEYGLHAQ